MPPTTDQYVAAVVADSARFAELAAGALDTPISFLGDWKMIDLVRHLGQVYAFVNANTSAPSLERSLPGAESEAPDGDEILEWFGERRQALLDSLDALADDTPIWTFLGDGDGAWWKRRMAHETTVHRWDVDAAVNGMGNAEPIESDMAADGVDEFLSFVLPRVPDRPDGAFPQGSLHLHRSDGPGEWMIDAPGGELVVTHEHGKGDAAVRGDAAELVLWVWGRPDRAVEIFGDESVAAAWQALAS